MPHANWPIDILQFLKPAVRELIIKFAPDHVVSFTGDTEASGSSNSLQARRYVYCIAMDVLPFGNNLSDHEAYSQLNLLSGRISGASCGEFDLKLDAESDSNPDIGEFQ